MHFAYPFLCGSWKIRLTHQYIPATVQSWPHSCDEDFAKDTSKAMYFISPFLFILSLCFPLMQCVQIYPLSGKSSWCPVIPIQRLHFHEGPYQTPTAHIFSVTSLLPQLLCDAVLLGTGLQKKTLIFPSGFLSCLSAGGGRGSSK